MPSALPCFSDLTLSALTSSDTPPTYQLTIYNKPITCTGTLTGVSFYALNVGDFYLDIFYISESNSYKYLRSSHTVTASVTGVQTFNFTSTISVVENDVFAIHYYTSYSTLIIPYASTSSANLAATGYTSLDLVNFIEKTTTESSIYSGYSTAYSWTTSEQRIPAVRLHITAGRFYLFLTFTNIWFRFVVRANVRYI